MKIIIAGAGDVGFHLAKWLSRESQDIYLIDTDRSKLDYAASHTDVFPVRGNSTRISVLEEAHVSEAALLIAVTDSEETNLLTAILAKRLGAARTIARVQNPEFLVKGGRIDLTELGIDSVVFPRDLLVREIGRLVDQTAATDAFEFADGKLSLMGIVLRASSPLVGKKVADTAAVNPERSFIPIAIHRGNQTIIPKGSTDFEAEDHVYFITQPEGMARITTLCGAPRRPIREIMIIGGGRTGQLCASMLEKKYRVKLVEKDERRCAQLADELPNTLVIHADAREVDALEEEGLGDADAFIALTGDSETNIITCLVAKNHDVGKTIALVENIDYINISQNIGIDALINRKLIAANSIFRHVRKGDVSAITSFHGVDAEVIEFIARKDSPICRSPIRTIRFPRRALIGGVIREEASYIVTGDFQVEPGDHVVVFSMPESIREVEKLFF